MAEAGRFAEWAEVHGNLYGTSLSEIEAARVSARTNMDYYCGK